MTINFVHGDLLQDSAEALVNTVNCVGVMGKGIALEFKNRWPNNYKFYKAACSNKELRPGHMLVWRNDSLLSEGEPKFIINFPTKDHWRNDSKIEYIENGLAALRKSIIDLNIKSIAIPPLGCGNGGLDWSVVKPLIVDSLEGIEGLDVNIYQPPVQKSIDPPEQEQTAIKMTYERALLIKAISIAEPHFFGEIDRLSLQKIAYLLQILGVKLNVSFQQNLWGPYSEKMKLAFRKMEEMQILSKTNLDSECIFVTRGGYAAADDFIQKENLNEDVIVRLIELISGYESPYGLELLANIHFYSELIGKNEVTNLLSSRSKRSHSYAESEINSGIKRLEEFGLV